LRTAAAVRLAGTICTRRHHQHRPGPRLPNRDARFGVL